MTKRVQSCLRDEEAENFDCGVIDIAHAKKRSNIEHDTLETDHRGASNVQPIASSREVSETSVLLPVTDDSQLHLSELTSD